MYGFKDFLAVDYTQTGIDQLALNAKKRKRDDTSGDVAEDDFKPHMMYDPETGKGYKAEKPEDHERMSKLGYTHEKPKQTNEVATLAQRQKMKAAFRKNKAKIALGRKKAAKKLATPDQLKKRAAKQARNFLIKKLTKGKDKGQMSFSQRAALEKQLEKKKGAIQKIAKKLLPKVKQADRAKLKTPKGDADGDGKADK